MLRPSKNPMPDLAEAETSLMGSRESVPSSDGDARAAKSGRLNLRVLFGLLGLAFVVKFAVFALAVGTKTSLSLPNAENWQDFSLAYAPAAAAFNSGFVPYRDFYYPYPPLFLWTLAAFAPAPYASWSSALPLVGADALTIVPVYLTARMLTSERVSRLVSILFILAPTNLYYADYLLLNPPLTTLFLMTSAYLMLKGKYGWSALALGLAIGFKQTALFALPVVVLIVWRRAGRKVEPLRYLLLVTAACLAFSLPYLILAPTLYIDSMFRLPLNVFGAAPLPSDYYQIGVGSGTQVTFDTSNWITSRWALLSMGVYSPATLALPFFIFLVPQTLFGFYSSSVLTYAMMLILLVGFVLVLRNAWKRRQIDAGDSLSLILWSMLVVFTFYPFYKYYFVGVVPLLVLLVRDKRDAVGFVAFSLALMLVPRYFGSWALLGALIWVVWRRLTKRQRVEEAQPPPVLMASE